MYFIFVVLIILIILKNIYRKRLQIEHYQEISENIYFLKKKENNNEFVKVIKILRNQLYDICRNSISLIYFKKEMMKRSKYLWIYFSQNQIIVTVIGFPMNQNDFYIDLFCSRASDILKKKYFGVNFLKTILSHIKEMGFQNVSLRSGRKKLISYYSKNFGFERKINSCNKKEKNKLIKMYKYSNPDDGYWMNLCL